MVLYIKKGLFTSLSQFDACVNLRAHNEVIETTLIYRETRSSASRFDDTPSFSYM